jgi:hypothetical protein
MIGPTIAKVVFRFERRLISLDKHVVLWQGRLQVWEMLKTMSKFVVDGATWHRILELIVRIFF